MDRIDLFRIFTRVVETGSFSKAADFLGMPRSSVSTAIQMLEQRVGVRLLARTTRSVSATPDGQAFYDQCVRLIVEVEDVENLFRQNHVSPRGLLRVNMPGRIGRLVVAPALPEFLDRYPDIDIELGVTDRPINLVEDGVDCVLRVGLLQDSSLIARKIAELPLVNVASPAYLARYGCPMVPEDLIHHQEVHYASPGTGRMEAWEWVDEVHGLHRHEMAGRVTVNSAEALIACCLAGLGLIQVPAYDVKVDLQAGRLVEVLPDYQAETLPLALVYPHRKHLSRRIQVFADWVVDVLSRHGVENRHDKS